MDETISKKSPVGSRLSRLPKSGIQFVIHGRRRVRLIDEVTLGRDKGSSMVIDDPLVSRFHCVIRRIRSGWYIEDVGSTNGTWVNERKIKAGKALRLSRTDTIKLGGRIEISLL